MDKTGESCPILSPLDEIVLSSSGHSHWSGLAAEAVIGGFGRWQGPRRGRNALRREGTNTEASTDDYPTTQCPVVR